MKPIIILLSCVVCCIPLHLFSQTGDHSESACPCSTGEEDRERVTFYIGGSTGITRLLDRENFVRSSTGYIAGLTAGLEIAGFRFNVFWNNIQYEATVGETKYRIQQQTIMPGLLFRIPLISCKKFETGLATGMHFPVMISSGQSLNYGKFEPDDPDLPWVGMMPGIQLDFKVFRKYEIGAAYYVAPLVNVGSFTTDPNNCQLWIAYHFR